MTDNTPNMMTTEQNLTSAVAEETLEEMFESAIKRVEEQMAETRLNSAATAATTKSLPDIYERGMQKLEISNLQRESRAKQLDSEYTFRPTLVTKQTHVISSPAHERLYDAQYWSRRQAKLDYHKSQNELKGCTFSPRINRNFRTLNNTDKSGNVFDRLYNGGKKINNNKVEKSHPSSGKKMCGNSGRMDVSVSSVGYSHQQQNVFISDEELSAIRNLQIIDDDSENGNIDVDDSKIPESSEYLNPTIRSDAETEEESGNKAAIEDVSINVSDLFEETKTAVGMKHTEEPIVRKVGTVQPLNQGSTCHATESSKLFEEEPFDNQTTERMKQPCEALESDVQNAVDVESNVSNDQLSDEIDTAGILLQSTESDKMTSVEDDNRLFKASTSISIVGVEQSFINRAACFEKEDINVTLDTTHDEKQLEIQDSPEMRHESSFRPSEIVIGKHELGSISNSYALDLEEEAATTPNTFVPTYEDVQKVSDTS